MRNHGSSPRSRFGTLLAMSFRTPGLEARTAGYFRSQASASANTWRILVW